MNGEKWQKRNEMAKTREKITFIRIKLEQSEISIKQLIAVSYFFKFKSKRIPGRVKFKKRSNNLRMTSFLFSM